MWLVCVGPACLSVWLCALAVPQLALCINSIWIDSISSSHNIAMLLTLYCKCRQTQQKCVVGGQEEDGEDSNSVLSCSPQAMLPSAAQPLSWRGHARYDMADSADGLQDALASQVCCPLASSDPQASLAHLLHISCCSAGSACKDAK